MKLKNLTPNFNPFLCFTFCMGITFVFAQSPNKNIDEPNIEYTDNSIKDLENVSKSLSLLDAIDLGLRLNGEERARKFKRAKFDLMFDDAYETFWYPNLSLSLQTYKHQIQTVQENEHTGTPSPLSPNGSLSLNLGDYTLFNWGKDYLEFLNAKYTYERDKTRLYEKRRKLKFDVIHQYFYTAYTKRIIKVRKDQLRHTSFIHRLTQEKLSLKRIDAQEFFQAKNDYLAAQSLYQDSTYDMALAEEKLANLLGDELSTSYNITNELKFTKISIEYSEALKFAFKNNPDLLDKNLFLENSNRTYQKVLKENLPLPKIALNLGAHSHNFSENGVSNNYQTDTDNKNVEITATINMTWQLFGEGGFFNQRIQKKSFLDKRIAEIEYFNLRRELEIRIKTLMRIIKRLERKVEFYSMQLKNARIVFDKAFDNYISAKTTFPALKLAIDGLSTAEIEYELAKLGHLQAKLNLSYELGLDDLPGENFEKIILE